MKTKTNKTIRNILSIALCLMLLCNIFTVVAAATDGLITIKMYDTTNDTWDGSQLQVYENGTLIATVEKKQAVQKKYGHMNIILWLIIALNG